METLSSVCTLEDWRAICQRAIIDAKAGDHRARDWLSKYLLPDSATASKTEDGDHEDFDYSNASADDVIGAMVALDRLKRSATKGNGRD